MADNATRTTKREKKMMARKTIKTPEGVAELLYFILPLKKGGKDAGYAVYKRGYETSTRCAQFGTGMEGVRLALAECNRLDGAVA